MQSIHNKLYCTVYSVPFKTSLNFFCNVSYRSLSVRSDDKGQSLVPICINMPWWSMTLLLVHYCLFLGPVLIDAHHGRTELLHKNGSFGFDPVELAFLTLLKRHQRRSFASGTPCLTCVSNWNQTSSTNLWFTEFSVYLHSYSNTTFKETNSRETLTLKPNLARGKWWHTLGRVEGPTVE